jgi:hypothetical protein
MKTVVLQIMSWDAEHTMDNEYTKVLRVSDDDFAFLKEKHEYYTSPKMVARTPTKTDIVYELEERSVWLHEDFENLSFPLTIDGVFWIEVEFDQ